MQQHDQTCTQPPILQQYDRDRPNERTQDTYVLRGNRLVVWTEPRNRSSPGDGLPKYTYLTLPCMHLSQESRGACGA